MYDYPIFPIDEGAATRQRIAAAMRACLDRRH